MTITVRYGNGHEDTNHHDGGRGDVRALGLHGARKEDLMQFGALPFEYVQHLGPDSRIRRPAWRTEDRVRRLQRGK
jgi:hypothetical protein